MLIFKALVLIRSLCYWNPTSCTVVRQSQEIGKSAGAVRISRHYCGPRGWIHPNFSTHRNGPNQPTISSQPLDREQARHESRFKPLKSVSTSAANVYKPPHPLYTTILSRIDYLALSTCGECQSHAVHFKKASLGSKASKKHSSKHKGMKPPAHPAKTVHNNPNNPTHCSVLLGCPLIKIHFLLQCRVVSRLPEKA